MINTGDRGDFMGIPVRHTINGRPYGSSFHRHASATSHSVTRVEPVVLSEHWKIENFSSVMKLAVPGDCLRSNGFRSDAFPDACWQICLFPGGKRPENANNVSLFLKMSSTSPLKEVLVKVEYCFSFLEENGASLFRNINVGEFHAKPPKGGHSWGLRNIPKEKIAKCLRSDDSVMLCCQIELIPDISKSKCLPVDQYMLPTQQVPLGFLECQESALDGGFMADCIIECSGQTVAVSRFALCTHSKVFRAMFSYETMRETRERRIVIEDTDMDTVRMMLRYMYCGRLVVGAKAVDLMQLAERYQIDPLKRICERDLCANVNKDNVLEMLALADMYNCANLETTAIDVFRSYKDYALRSEAWESLKRSNVVLANKLMEHVVMLAVPPPVKRLCHERSLLTLEGRF